GDFDPARTVVLETSPATWPESKPEGEPDTVRVVANSTDSITIDGDLRRPAILVVTDGYSKDWHARPLAGSSQTSYDVLPANYVLMAVPLSAGHHTFQLVYDPASYEAGKWISLASVAAIAGLLVSARRRSTRRL